MDAIEKGGVIGGGVSFRLWRNLAVGLDVSSYRSVNPAQITAELPHPFFFDLPRTTMGETGGLERQEIGVHVRALWVMQLTNWLVGPGPYSFRISISDSGSTRAPFNRRVQCRCGPVTRPVAPA